MNINETLQLLHAADLANDTALLEGLHGIGKSEAVNQFAVENDYFCQELFLSMMDTGDLIGIPRTNTVGTSTITTWAQPDWFQRITDEAFPQLNKTSDLVFTNKEFEEFVKSRVSAAQVTRTEINDLYCEFFELPNDSLRVVMKDSCVSSKRARRSVLFLDELNRSNLDVRQATLQLILNKELHSHKLPYVNGKCTIIVAAINPSDNYQVDELDPALLDRFIHAEVKADAKSWLTWARGKNLNQIVQDYIAEHPDRIHWTPKDGGIGATPRSWTKLAAFMDNIDSIPKEIQFQVMKGKIGSELAGQFLSFYNNYSKVIKLEDVEKLVEKHAKRSKNPETISKHVAKLIAKQEAIQKNQLAEALYEKYIKKQDDATTALPALAFLYALEIELLASFLKSRKESDAQDYLKLAKFDKELNEKGLFTRITTKVNK